MCLFVTSDQSSALSSGWPASSKGEENLPSARLPAAVTPLCLKVQPFVGFGLKCQLVSYLSLTFVEGYRKVEFSPGYIGSS